MHRHRRPDTVENRGPGVMTSSCKCPNFSVSMMWKATMSIGENKQQTCVPPPKMSKPSFDETCRPLNEQGVLIVAGHHSNRH